MNSFISKAALEARRARYKKGARVELIFMTDPYTKLKPGDTGTVDFVDDTGTVFIIWDSGSHLGAVFGEDEIRLLSKAEVVKAQCRKVASTGRTNMSTILIVLVLGHLLTGMLIIAYTRHQHRSQAVNMFLLSKLLQPAAWVMLGLRGLIPSMILVAVGNSTLFTGAALELIALMMLKSTYTETVKRCYTALLIGCILVFISATAYGFPENVRITFASSITAILMIFPVYKLFTDNNASRLQRVIAALYSLTIAFLIFRAIAALTTDLDMNLASTSIFNTWLFLLLYVVMLAGSTGFILLDKEKQDFELLRAASFDGLTGILNRGAFILHSKELIASCLRKQEKNAFLLMDIDDFKKINDKYGHFVGDAVLRDFALTLKNQLQSRDLFGRYGGEEFAILLPETDEKSAAKVAEQLRATAAHSSIDSGLKVGYTISIGFLSILPDEGIDIDTLYKLCDQALYLAKSHGKNCCRSAAQIRNQDVFTGN